MIQPSPMLDPRLIIEALHVPIAVVMATSKGHSAGDSDLEYYAVSAGFSKLYAAMYTTLKGRPGSPLDWRGLRHAEVFPVIADPDHEWAVQLMGALTGESSGWIDVAWDASDEGMITVAYQLTAVVDGWAALEAVDIAGHAARILGNGSHHV